MPSRLPVIAGFVLALLISGGPAALADTSCSDYCPWVRPAATSIPKRLKFSLSVALKVFSISKPATNSVQPDVSAAAEPGLHDFEHIDVALASQLSPLELQPDPKGLPKLLSWMRGWRFEKDRGLFRPVHSRSRVAFAYSDIFETGGNPDKGGHGIGFLFRHDLGPKPQRDVY